MSIRISDLNPPQQEAVLTLQGPLLVLAGAGTGKTRVVTYRMANLIRHGTEPDRILAVTFTNKAANEMQERVHTLLGSGTSSQRVDGRVASRSRKPDSSPSDKKEPFISTFHSLCVQILRRNIDQLGYPLNFSICDRGDQESFARQALREIRVTDKLLRPADLLACISQFKSNSIRPAEAAIQAQDDREHLAASAYRRYQEALRGAGAVDFDDLLLCTEDLFRRSPAIQHAEADRFDHVLIDEYQDTNSSQYRIVKGLAEKHRNLCVVGDDDQSIYGWRGADVRHILRFAKDWTDAKVVRLEDNYRSTAAILEFSNRLIAFNKTRHDKTLRPARMGGSIPRVLQFKTETEEAEKTVLEIKRNVEAKRCEPNEVAILFRTNEQPRLFEAELRKHNIPYTLVGGMSFFDRREVKDVVSFLQLVVRPDDDMAMRRVINVPARGVSRPAAQLLIDTAAKKGTTLWQLFPILEQIGGLSPAAVRGLQAFGKLITDFQTEFQKRPMAPHLKRMLEDLHYFTELRTRYDNEQERVAREESVEQIVTALAQYEEKKKRKGTLVGFLDEIALTQRDIEDDKEKQLRGNRVVLMTLHSAKGLEFPFVYMVGMEEGILPHRRSLKDDNDYQIEEERRLCYVGVTRAQESLTLSLALSRMKWGKAQPTDASRFLWEMTGMADRFVPGKRASGRSTTKKKAATKHASPAQRPSRSPAAKPAAKKIRPKASPPKANASKDNTPKTNVSKATISKAATNKSTVRETPPTRPPEPPQPKQRPEP